MSQDTPLKFLALGDSYTIGERVTEDERWPNQLAKLLSTNKRHFVTTIIATTGWRTDNLANAIDIAQLKPEYSLVSLLIGVNNQYQGKSIDQYSIEFEELLKTSIRLAKGNRKNVFVVSIPDYGYTPFGEKKKDRISADIDHFNSMNEKISEKYGVAYVDITAISRQGLSQPELVAPDGLHPSGKMYALWVKQIAVELKNQILLK
ncbi:MAG: esterase [Cytophagales bacterium]|jgi:lysophospholipase L1-like esterase|nr:SGNH/GDSL hydrolase family protein [Bacteroidota bacterium]MBS1979633.1 SGNH/GDSL hydrolase family protein [Bacteroidota bacterium]WHZ09166.1 MAG: esterase [Cytophagales bacterium]